MDRQELAEPSLDSTPVHGSFDERTALSLDEAVGALGRHLRMLMAVPLLVAAVAIGASYLMPPIYTARTTFLPPQQSGGLAAAALAQLGPLAGLAGNVGGTKSSAEQYVALMQSVTVSDRIVDKFGLLAAYDERLRVDARAELSQRVRFTIGKKDGLISVSADDESAAQAAAMANQYVEELRLLTSALAVTEAQQRRVFFENEWKQSRVRLELAQRELQQTAFDSSALNVEPKATAEAYARLRAEVTAAEIRLRYLRSVLADGANEIKQQQALYGSLRSQLLQAGGRREGVEGSAGYITKYREFKYQETLFELYARQFELARVDEIRDGGLIQVVDVAAVPERKSKPRRAIIAAGAAIVAGLLLAAGVLAQTAWRKRAKGKPSAAAPRP